MISKKILSIITFTAAVGIAGCNSTPVVKVVNVPNKLDSMHTTTVDKARQSLAIGGAQVYYDNSIQFTIVMPDRLTFNKEGTQISSWEKTYLDKLISVLNGPNINSVSISSHYDNNFGVFLSDKYSQQYAYTFAEYLKNNGLRANNVSVESLGTRAPISQNENKYGNDANKRIELVVKLSEPENVQTEKDYKESVENKNKTRFIKKNEVGNEVFERRIERPKNPL